MSRRLNVLGISGSASSNSSNLAILKIIADKGHADFDLTIVDDLTVLPHFRTELTDENTPEAVIEFRNQIKNADGVIICTPEYVFSIPAGLKNAIEWCVSTTVFSDKPMGLITASTSGEKAQAELQLIMKTIQTNFTEETTLLIKNIKGKVSRDGEILDEQVETELVAFIESVKKLISKIGG